MCVLFPYALPWTHTINDCLVGMCGKPKAFAFRWLQLEGIIYMPSPSGDKVRASLKSYPAWLPAFPVLHYSSCPHSTPLLISPGSTSFINNLHMHSCLKVCFGGTVILYTSETRTYYHFSFLFLFIFYLLYPPVFIPPWHQLPEFMPGHYS